MYAPTEALPLYGLETLGDARQVIVVEGEKCRDALATVTGRAVVSWAGGTQGVKHTDWSPLVSRNVVIWPDADGPGLGTADEIAQILIDLGATVRVMDVMRDNPPKGWDAADAIRDGWDKGRLDEFMRATVRPWSSPKPPTPPATEKAADKPSAPAGPVTPAAPVRDDVLASESIYVVKGHIHEAVDRAMAVLSNASLGIYARGDDLVRAVTYSMPARTLTVAKQGENVDRPDGAVIIATLSDVALVETLTRHARFAKWDGRADKFVPCDCPAEVARMILANKGHGWTVPRLAGRYQR